MQTSRGDFSKPENNDNCQSLAPFVMALFDGEADEMEARRARAHLLICQTCANRWLDWNRSRDLLRVSPVPAPPPLLLWRVLMACRIATFSPVKNPRFSRRRAQSQSQFQAPADFSAQIFALTTRASDSHSALEKTRGTKPVFSLAKLPYLAAPALAIWLMILQSDFSSTAGLSTVELSRVSAQKSDSRAGFFARRSNQESRGVISGGERFARASMKRNLQSTRARLLKTAPLTPIDVINGDSERDDLRRTASVLIATQAPRAPRMARETPFRARHASFFVGRDFKRDSTKNEATTIVNAATQKFEQEERAAILPVSPASNSAPRRAKFALAIAHRAPILRAARWKNSASMNEQLGENVKLINAVQRAPRDQQRNELQRESQRQTSRQERRFNAGAPQLLRVSLPTATRAPAGALLLTEHFEEDSRIDEMRSVVDDFRAALAPDDEASSENEEGAEKN